MLYLGSSFRFLQWRRRAALSRVLGRQADSMSPTLQLEPLQLRVPHSERFAAYRQLNIKASRKQVAPATGAFFQSEGVAKKGGGKPEEGSAP